MTLQQAIKKYGLIKQERTCFGDLYTYDFYTNEKESNGKKTIWSVEQDELAKEEGELVYCLIIETFDYNKIITNKYGFTRPYSRTRITRLDLA